MDKIKYVLIAIGFSGFFISCNQTRNPETDQTEFVNNNHYVSIDGLWRVTPETAIKYPHGTLEPIIQISGDAFGKITIRGCFLWEGRFYDDWDLKCIQFTDSTHEFVMKYDDNGVYKGMVDQKKEMIRGIAYWDEEDTTDLDTIDFIRDQDLDINKLFIPYPPCPDGSLSYAYHQPEKCNDQLQTASLFEYVKDTTSFNSLMESIIRQKFGRLESFLIIKDQKLVLEEYFFGYDRTQLHYINSCTKSITSLLLGIALERHNKLDVDQPAFNFFPQYDSLLTPEKEKITLKHVLSMTAGIQEENGFKGTNPDDYIKYIFSLPIKSNPGEIFKYSAECTNLLGTVIYTLENMQADEFAKDVLFNKLSISEFDWERENGLVPCDAGLYMYPRDMAKIGLLVLNDGYWNGEQLVPKEWINISTKPHIAESEFFDYGYQWWCRSKQNTPWWNNPVRGGKTEHDMALALGHGGQFIMIIRELNMAIVITSSDNNEGNGKWLAKVPMVIEKVVPLFD
jgi:CubicO group peptidase (beta-lactamase class C family)